MTTTLGNSNVRGNLSRQTRINPIRVTRGFGTSQQRYNSLTSNSGLPLGPATNAGPSANPAVQNNDPPRLYPAITHFADTIAALPREFRRHNSLLKEVDAKAWEAEENLQNILKECLADPAISDPNFVPAAYTAPGSVIADDTVNAGDSNSVAAVSFDNASLASARSADPAVLQRRQQFHALRQHLMAIMVTMDEKNHVINNANEEVAKHIRRLDRVWPHISDEISEEVRLGSLRHWAYTDLNPVKKPTAPTSRKEAATSGTALNESEIAHRSEARREAIQARKQRNNHQVDSDFDEAARGPSRKTNTNGKKRAAEAAPDPAGLGITGAGAGAGKRKKPDKPLVGGVGMERTNSSAMGGRPMSRENSQQENAKKRKASTAATTVARKRYAMSPIPRRQCTNTHLYRINASTQDSPKLASSPLAGAFGKEAYKKSPALSTVRPAGRGRQNSSTQVTDTARARPSSSNLNKNSNNKNVSASTPELNNVAAMTGKSTSEVKTTMKESKTDKGDRLLEDKSAAANGSGGDQPLRGAILLERSASRQEGAKAELSDEAVTKAVGLPRLPPPLLTSELKNERVGRGRASKTSTPVAGTFAEADEGDTASTNGNGHNGSKAKRPSRPRVKDHGLHDSLSPKGLPMKRPHKKSVSLSGFPPLATSTQRLKDETDAPNSTTSSERGGVDNENGEDGEDGEDIEPAEDDEERYCYCQGVSYGEMVACDKPDCPRQWFHLECIGLKSVPKSAKWYCDECKEALAKKGRVAGNGGNGNGK